MARTEAEIMRDFESLECELSPENLHCDGEISHEEAQLKYNDLMDQWEALERELGRKVVEGEGWDYRQKNQPKKDLGLPY